MRPGNGKLQAVCLQRAQAKGQAGLDLALVQQVHIELGELLVGQRRLAALQQDGEAIDLSRFTFLHVLASADQRYLTWQRWLDAAGLTETDTQGGLEFDLLDLQHAQRLLGGDGAGRAHGGQIGKRDARRRQPCAAIDLGLARQRQLERGHIGLARLRRDIDRARHHALEQALRARQHLGRIEPLLHPAEQVEHHLRRRDSLADVDRIDEIVGKVRARLDAFLFDLVGEDDIEFGSLAVDLLLRWRIDQRIGDHAADIGQRGLPVIAERREGDEGGIDRARDIVLLDLRIKEAAAAARAALEPAIDDRLCQRIEHQALVINDGILDRPPRAQIRAIWRLWSPSTRADSAAKKASRPGQSACRSAISKSNLVEGIHGAQINIISHFFTAHLPQLF